MPVTLRKRPQCHYCGKRLNTTKRDGNRIPCDQCSSENYFDTDNNIIDVPSTEVDRLGSQQQLHEVESESDVFCKKCLTNQAFYVQALSNYLPDETDPQYQRLLDELPQYQRDLDLRYPQCCVQCEPRAAGRIQEANYMAKSDNLRRTLHRKHDRRRTSQLRVRSLLISAAGCGYATSLVIQLLWHALSSQINSQHIVPGISPVQCFRQWPVPAQCTHYVASFVPLSLFISLLCIWWNPMWQYRLMEKEGRLVGLSKYYKIQLSISVLRFAAWAAIEDLPAVREHANAVHTILLVMLSAMSIYALVSVVKVDTTPLVDWQQVQAPLVRPDQFRLPSQPISSLPSSQDVPKLNLADFAAPVHSMYEPWKPPTPPTEDDSMDWTPSALNFNPQPRMPKAKFEQQNPFHGALPAAPTRGSLNPKAPPPPPQRKALGLPPGFFGLSKSRADDQQVSASQNHASDAFAAPKFFPNKRESDTGLENIFDKMFSVRDPLDVPSQTQTPESRSGGIFGQETFHSGQRRRSFTQEQLGSSQPPIRMVLSCAIIVSLAVVLSSLCSLELLYGATTSAPSELLPFTASIPAVHLLEEIIYTGQIELVNLAVFAVEISLAVAARVLIPKSGSELVPVWNKMVIGVVCFFMLQEIYRFCQLQNIPHGRQNTLQAPLLTQDTIQQTLPLKQQYLEQSAVSHASPQRLPPPQHAPPTPISRSAYLGRDYGTVRKRDSDESISSTTSINTTSTASGWKTPQNTGRTYDFQLGDRSGQRAQPRNTSLGFGGLSLGNDFGSSTNVAGPRNRQTQGNGNGSGNLRYKY